MGGWFVTQASSPYFVPDAFWSIAGTIRQAGFRVFPYHAGIPSFGDWGFVLANVADGVSSVVAVPGDVRVGMATRFIADNNFAKLFVFAKDIGWREVAINQLDRPVLLDYYLEGWRSYAH